MCFFFFNDTATTEIYTLSLHDALPIFLLAGIPDAGLGIVHRRVQGRRIGHARRSEEHTSELQSPCNLVCRLLLEKKKNHTHNIGTPIPRPEPNTPPCHEHHPRWHGTYY